MKLDPTMSKPRWLTLIVSLGSIVWTIAFWWSIFTDPVQGTGIALLIMCVPICLLGVAVSLLPMSKRTRIMLYWLTAFMMSFVGVLTLMSGIGLFLLAAVFAFLLAAWLENESGEPAIPHRRGDIITNPRIRPRA